MELRDYLNILNRRKWVIIITIVAALAAVFVRTRLQTPIYESSITMRVATSSSGGSTSSTFTTQMLNTVAQIATSGPVLNETMSMLNLTYSPIVTAEVITNTELIKITVEDPNPRNASDIAVTLGDILIAEGNSIYIGAGVEALTVLGTQVAQAEKDVLTTSQKYAQSLLATPAAVAESSLLSQEMTLQQRNYDALLSQYRSLLYQNAIRQNMVSVVEAPTIATKPVKPNLIQNLIIGLGCGVIGGLLIMVIMNLFDTKLYTAQEIEQYTGYLTFARIPKARKTLKTLALDGNSAFTDSFRELSIKIQHMDRKKPIKVILVFSAEANQGKSMIITHLAVSLAESGKSVVAVDCDLRLPKLHKLFELPNAVGLADVLEERLDLEAVLQATKFERLSVITSQENTDKPILLLSSQAMKRLVSSLSQKFDFVLLDTPALLEVGDAAFITDNADGILLIARRRYISREAAKSVGGFMKNFTDKFTALIVNEDSRGNNYYYHHSDPEVNKYSSDYLLNRLGYSQNEANSVDEGKKRFTSLRDLEPEVEEAVVAMAMEQPLYGQIRVSNELRKKSIYVTPGSVRTIWLRNGLETFEKRFLALESKASIEPITLSKSQLEALEKAKADRSAEAEIESDYPGNLGVQDSVHIGRIDGIGRIYQQTFIDAYTGFAFAKIYYQKNVESAVDLFKTRVMPFFIEENITLQRVLTDQDSIYCGSLHEHGFEKILSASGCEHNCTDGWHPKTNGICVRFHKLVHDDFYLATLRNKTYTSIEELQLDLDNWIKIFNYERSYPGKYCFGRTPYETLQAMRQLAKSEIL